MRILKNSLGVVLASLTCFDTLHAGVPVSATELENEVRHHIRRELQQRDLITTENQQVTIGVSKIDPRLKLPGCTTRIQIETNSRRWVGRLNSKVSCKGAHPWSIYVPVQVRLIKQVVVATEHLHRGDLLDISKVRLLKMDITDYPRGYFADTKKVLGKELKRAVAMNNPLSPAHLTEPYAIRRGEEVMIVANTGKVAIRIPGIALSDGRIGQQIRVKNASSKRVVKARVMQRGVVNVLI